MSGQFRQLPQNNMAGFIIHQAKLSQKQPQTMILSKEQLKPNIPNGLYVENESSFTKLMMQQRPALGNAIQDEQAVSHPSGL